MISQHISRILLPITFKFITIFASLFLNQENLIKQQSIITFHGNSKFTMERLHSLTEKKQLLNTPERKGE